MLCERTANLELETSARPVWWPSYALLEHSPEQTPQWVASPALHQVAQLTIGSLHTNLQEPTMHDQIEASACMACML